MKHSAAKSNFYPLLWSLVIPITIQSLINNAVNAADVFMLGYVGESALSAVSLANQIQFIISGIFWGITSGISILVSQYWGKRDVSSIQSVMGIGFKLSLMVTLLVALAAALFPHLLMRIFTPDQALIALGVDYLRIIGVSYVFQSVTQVYECALRSMNRAKVSTAISSCALFLNIVLNAVLIFGLLGFPRLGVVGVAVATVIARLVELVLCLMDAKRSMIRYEAKLVLGHNKLLFSDFLRYSLPALLNDISWTVAFSTYSIILGHLGSNVVAAAAVATTIRDLCTVVCMSLGSAAVVIVGQEIGKGALDTAKEYGRRMVTLSLLIGAATGVVILIIRPLVLWLYPLSLEARDYLSFMLLVSSFYIVGQSVNTAVITGVFRAGGDTKFGMICDTVNMWCVAVPVGFLCAFAFDLPVKVVYFVLCLDEFYKLPVVYHHYKRYLWLHNVTRETPTLAG